MTDHYVDFQQVDTLLLTPTVMLYLDYAYFTRSYNNKRIQFASYIKLIITYNKSYFLLIVSALFITQRVQTYRTQYWIGIFAILF